MCRPSVADLLVSMVTQFVVLQLLYEHEEVALFLFFCLADVKDTKYYMPAALKQTDMCSACPACCVYDNTTDNAVTETTSVDDNAVTETTSVDDNAVTDTTSVDDNAVTETTSVDDNAVTETTNADGVSDDPKYVRDSGCVMSYTTAAWLVVIVCHLLVL